MKRLMMYLKDSKKESILAPLFKLLEAEDSRCIQKAAGCSQRETYEEGLLRVLLDCGFPDV